MAGNWMDDRERQIRERAARGLRDGRDDDRSRSDEDRSWIRDRVFGERESGASYGGAQGSGPRGGSAARGWQSPDYEGVSPAMRQGAYGGAYGRGARFTSQDYTTGGGRFYGDDERERIYPEEYGARGHDPQRSRTRERYHAEGYGQPGYGGYPGEHRQDRPLSGDPGGDESRGERFAEAGRGAGEFLHRAGEKVAHWFGAGSESRLYDPDYLAPNQGKRGLGPQGYKRSDERINDDAHERLTDDAWLDASNISISVSAGEVTLSGTVDSREAKHRAERLVEDLSGVTHVQNNLRVAKGSFLTSPASGYGDSVLGAQMRAADDAVDNGAGKSGKKN